MSKLAIEKSMVKRSTLEIVNDVKEVVDVIHGVETIISELRIELDSSKGLTREKFLALGITRILMLIKELDVSCN